MALKASIWPTPSERAATSFAGMAGGRSLAQSFGGRSSPSRALPVAETPGFLPVNLGEMAGNRLFPPFFGGERMRTGRMRCIAVKIPTFAGAVDNFHSGGEQVQQNSLFIGINLRAKVNDQRAGVPPVSVYDVRRAARQTGRNGGPRHYTGAQVRRIVLARRGAATGREISRAVGMTESQISRIYHELPEHLK